MDDKNLDIYKAVINACSNIELKGKNMLYTSDNGYMFSLYNKAGDIGFRFSEARKKELINQLNTTDYKSYGATMRGYVKMPKSLFKDISKLREYLIESHNYVMSLEPK
ncbi:hypothetical protein RM697_09695 [Ichthyenterobacterium sp. W332]|uniref:TfoX N-terminal domain-containing protein n=1 Tax=Microcosmobacter mediterraneus TaxID=3075607 RepID=A0ABU2YL82_9FLAO|nr:hypothetical protein [Ichthyenterobacterium sp. W332]MDT0558922.1 hypothetical protein [Ichthyenterobacterium sp. W332]